MFLRSLLCFLVGVVSFAEVHSSLREQEDFAPVVQQQIDRELQLQSWSLCPELSTNGVGDLFGVSQVTLANLGSNNWEAASDGPLANIKIYPGNTWTSTQIPLVATHYNLCDKVSPSCPVLSNAGQVVFDTGIFTASLAAGSYVLVIKINDPVFTPRRVTCVQAFFTA